MMLSIISQAFQNDFETTDRNPVPEDAKLYEKRFFANAPYSFCQADGIPNQWCTSVGLRIDKATFKNLFIRDDPYKMLSYDEKVAFMPYEKISLLVNDYYLVPYNYTTKPFHIPTEGQLSWMIRNGYVPKRNASTKYFVTHTEGSRTYVRIGRINGGFEDVQHGSDIAAVYRLATEDVPDICQNTLCEEFLDKRSFTIKFKNSCNAIWNWRVEFTNASGRRDGFEGYWQGQYTLPYGASDVDVMARQASFHYSKIENIHNTDRPYWTDFECYQLQGGCTAYTLKNVPCTW